MTSDTCAVKGANGEGAPSFDADAARKHLQFMFGGLDQHPLYKTGWIELAVGGLKQARYFPLRHLDRAVTFAAEQSAVGSKVYVHQGLLKPDYAKIVRQRKGEKVGHSDATAVWCWPCLWGEADAKHLGVDETLLTREETAAARLAAFTAAAGDHGLQWGWVQSTGTVPSLRLQGFMRLREPAAAEDPDFKQALKSLSRAGKLDLGATNSSQVLRLCGSLSPAGGAVKTDEIGEAPRITEGVRRLTTAPAAPVDLETIVAALDLSGVLGEGVTGGVNRPPAAKNVDALTATVTAPAGAVALDKEAVRKALAGRVRTFAAGWIKDGGSRRDEAMKLAKLAGGYLWTGAFEAAELWDDEADGDDPALSIVAAYVLNGGEDANGMNGLAEGLLGPLTSGAAKPIAKLFGTKASDGAAFGTTIDDGGDEPDLSTPTRLRIEPTDVQGTAEKIVGALLKRRVEIFRRGGQLVQVVLREPPPQLHATGAAVAFFLPLNSLAFWALVSENVHCLVQRGDKLMAMKTPRDITDSILARVDRWPFPDIAAVTSAPILRPDGTIANERGYDRATQTYITETTILPPIPARPTREDGVRALALLSDLLRGFPFATEAHRSAALSAMISTTCRQRFPVVPATLLSAPQPGSGKSFFVDVVSMIATGRPCAAMAAGGDERETEKRIDAHLLAGTPLVSIDNLNGTIGGDKLCQLIERQLIDVRTLGRSDTTQVLNCFTTFLNGNNPNISTDMARRVLVVRLEPNVEMPEQREFPNNPVADIRDARGTYLACCFVIVKAWMGAQEDGKATPIKRRLASFETWSDVVRSAIVWLGHADPVDTMEDGRETDPKLQARRDILGAWHRLLGSKPVTAAEALAAADAEAASIEREEGAGMTLHDALAQHLPPDRRGEQLVTKLGYELRRYAGAVVDGLRVDGSRSMHGKVWRVTRV